MRVVILGGLGLIGKAFSKIAFAKGHEIIALTRSKKIIEQADPRYHVETWDGVNVEKLSTLIENADAVINLAGESIGKGRWTADRKEKLLDSRLAPAKALVEALSRCKRPPSTLIQASAIGFYGTGEDEKTENSPSGNDYLARFAVKWEDSTKAVEGLGIRRIIIRTGIVLDIKQGALPQLMLPFKLMAGGPIGSGRQVYSWIHIEDEAAAILYLLETSSCTGIYNLTSPSPLRNSEIGKALAKVMKRPYWLPVPGFTLQLVLGEMSTLVLDGQRVLPERLSEAGYKFIFPDLEGALKNLLRKC